MDPQRQLSPAWRRLLMIFLRLGYGRVERLQVRHGAPVFETPPRVVAVYKTCPGDNGRRRALSVAELARSQQVRALMHACQQLEDGVIDLIEVQNDLPFLFEIAGIPA